MLRVAPAGTGTLESIRVREGDRVRKGQVLAQLFLGTAADGGTLEGRRADALHRQAQALAARAPAAAEASAAQRDRLRAEQGAARRSLVQLDGQLVEQRGLLASAEEDLARLRAIAVRGFVTRNDLRLREETRAQRHQALLRMEQDRIDLLARIAGGDADMRRARADQAVADAEAQRAEAGLAVEKAGMAAQSRLDIVAPGDGIVTGLDGTPGARVSPDRPLLSIVPTGTKLVARIAIPAEGAGFVRPGQPVALALDAFPREMFGTMPARIASVTAAGVSEGQDARADRFVAIASLSRPFVAAYGERQALRPGMSFTATIVTRRLSLMRWLLDPLFAVMAR